MESFDGQYIKFDGKNLKLNSPDGTALAAMDELKLFKKMVQLRKKETNEQIRIIRSEAAEKRAHRGPASLDLGYLLFRGTKFGPTMRTLGMAGRASDRSNVQSQIEPHENYKRQLEFILTHLTKIEIMLKKEIMTNY